MNADPMLFWTRVAAIGEVVSAAATIAGFGAVIYAAMQLRLQKNISRGEFVFHLYKLLEEHNELHSALKAGRWPSSGKTPDAKDWNEIGRYMGLFEAVYGLVKARILKVSHVDSFLSHRLAPLATNEHIEKSIRPDRLGWRDFNELIDELALNGPLFQRLAAAARAARRSRS